MAHENEFRRYHLKELLRFACDHRLTASVELRSEQVVGRIDIRQGEVIDAAFGGLVGVDAVRAALCRSLLTMRRGRDPSRAAVRRIYTPTARLLDEGIKVQLEPLSQDFESIAKICPSNTDFTQAEAASDISRDNDPPSAPRRRRLVALTLVASSRRP